MTHDNTTMLLLTDLLKQMCLDSDEPSVHDLLIQEYVAALEKYADGRGIHLAEKAAAFTLSFARDYIERRHPMPLSLVRPVISDFEPECVTRDIELAVDAANAAIGLVLHPSMPATHQLEALASEFDLCSLLCAAQTLACHLEVLEDHLDDGCWVTEYFSNSGPASSS